MKSNNNYLKLTFLVILIGFYSICLAEGQSNTGTLTGKVYDIDTLLPIQQVSVTAYRGSTLMGVANTDSLGVYTIILEGGATGQAYEVTYEKIGYYPEKIEHVMVIAGVTTSQDVYLEPSEYAPVADADGPYTVIVGESFQLDESGSYDIDGGIVLYEWDLDNDGTYDLSSTSATSMSTSYSIPGFYTVVLRVTDDNGLYDTDETTVTVNPDPFIVPEIPYGSITAFITMLLAFLYMNKEM